MLSLKSLTAVAAFAVALSPAPGALAQTSNQDRFGQVLEALLGQGSSLDARWQRGERPLSEAQSQFQARLDSDVRSGALTTVSANRLRADFSNLVMLENQYAVDGRFTAQERADLAERYGAITQRLGQPGEAGDDTGPSVAEGRADFEARVNAAVAARRITRTQATRLRADYVALIQLEAASARDGISAREREDLDARLDALDERLGDGPQAQTQAISPRARLADILAVVAANERSGAITRPEALDIREAHGDLAHLEIAYGRSAVSAEDSAYLLRRISELEARARINRR
ncbi:hypothetical protein JKL49_08620 [Phenylobacterium sp. 20VBR1]|uniref:Uncharacterized protein n=1 Tax=Phenylobacterium glaciei TaxID=2803784 RepID=A0A941D3A1_9CAUL|nr:hypothetical protein [Phenylobacterium glaciei]MBR7619448.1 hypothetical protein [Phenylobacterium glaciei]QQZ51773.1 hypothetical protein JKL49_13240 [Phenylobacterium glaciei]